MTPVRLRVEGTDLPGRDCPGLPGDPGYRNVHVGVQRRNRPGELLALTAGDAASASWDLDRELSRTRAGRVLVTPRRVQRRPTRWPR